MRTIRVSILGPPGAGKGTYASEVARFFGVPHVSTGELLRQEIRKGSELGRRVATYVSRGLLVPDDVVNELVGSRLSQDDCAKGFVLDGYPRTLHQALFLEKHYPLDKAVLLNVSLKVAVERLSGRLYCPNCGETYHVSWKPPRKPGVCDNCGSRLVRRRDDDPEVVEARFREYWRLTLPVVDFYREKGKLLEFDANGDSRELAPRLVSILAGALAKTST